MEICGALGWVHISRPGEGCIQRLRELKSVNYFNSVVSLLGLRIKESGINMVEILNLLFSKFLMFESLLIHSNPFPVSCPLDFWLEKVFSYTHKVFSIIVSYHIFTTQRKGIMQFYYGVEPVQQLKVSNHHCEFSVLSWTEKLY